MRSKGSAAELERRRQLAVQRIEEGWSQQEVADFLGVTIRSVSRWLRAYRETGLNGLRAKPATGSRAKLTAEQEQAVLGWLDRSPREFGFDRDQWTTRSLAAAILDQFGVRFNSNYMAEWLTKRKRSFHRSPKRHHPDTNARASVNESERL